MRMDRKRVLEGGGSATLPPSKQARTPQSTSSNKEEDGDDENTTLRAFQRAQLAAKVADQERELAWARSKIEELQCVVTALDAAPMSASYYMAACVEELSQALSHSGMPAEEFERDPEITAPVAATLLDAEVITNESLGEQPRTLKRLTTHVVVALQRQRERRARKDAGEDVENTDGDGGGGGGGGGGEGGDTDLPVSKEANEDLRARLRVVSDQLERYADRDKQNMVAATTLRDELDDCKALLDGRRRRIVALEVLLRQLRSQPLGDGIADMALSAATGIDPSGDAPLANGNAGTGQSARGVPLENGGDEHRPAGDGSGLSAGGIVLTGPGADAATVAAGGKHGNEVATLHRLAQDRLVELNKMVEEKKEIISQLHAMSTELAQRQNGVIPIKDILNSALYQTMEATLQQLYLKERSWETERATEAEERLEERKDAEARLQQASTEAEKEAEELRKQVEDLRRVAESAKAEKDKWIMTYEARRTEANGAASQIEAADSRAAISEKLREKLRASNKSLIEENNKMRERLQQAERSASGDETLGGNGERVERLEKDLEAERGKCASFIEEVESLSEMYSELEAENARLIKLLAEKESVLSKVMSDRLRGRQQLTTVKEEARALSQGRELDQEKVKNLGMQVAASKRLAAESAAVAAKATEEARSLGAQLAQQRKLADESVVSARTAQAEKETLKKELEVAQAQAEEARVEGETSGFNVRRLTEENESLKTKLEAARKLLQDVGPAGGGNGDPTKDEIIQELMKKLHCSVVTNQPKEVALMRCGHMMSRQCVNQLIAGRSRKCPLCGLSFSESDVLSVYLD